MRTLGEAVAGRNFFQNGTPPAKTAAVDARRRADARASEFENFEFLALGGEAIGFFHQLDLLIQLCELQILRT